MQNKKSPKTAKNRDASLLVRLCPPKFGDAQQRPGPSRQQPRLSSTANSFYPKSSQNGQSNRNGQTSITSQARAKLIQNANFGFQPEIFPTIDYTSTMLNPPSSRRAHHHNRQSSIDSSIHYTNPSRAAMKTPTAKGFHHKRNGPRSITQMDRI